MRTPPRTLQTLAVALLFVLPAALPGCSGSKGPVTADTLGSQGAFDPKTMRIYPLTHVEHPGPTEGAAGPTRIVCHIEFTDQWFDTVKALGRLQITLYRPGGGLNPARDVQEANWDLDLTDLTKNAEWFDPVTRTYRVQLNLPAWVQAKPGTQIRLRVIFTPAGANAAEGTLHDEYSLHV